MNNVQIIMPDENKDEDMQVMAGLLLTMGRYLKDNRGSLAVKKRRKHILRRLTG